MSIEITPVGYAAGAEVRGIDLKKPLSRHDRNVIHEAWLNHLALVFPEQNLDPEELLAFARNFGDLDDHSSLATSTLHPGHCEILVLSNKKVLGKKSGTHNSGRNWHTDLSYTTRPAKGAVLNCKEAPPVGGDTMLANMYVAYDTLSAPIRKLLDGLRAIHDVSLIKGIEKRGAEVIREMKERNPPVSHPVVRTHPETGKKSLLVGQRIRTFVDMSEEESAAILAMLNEHATSPEFVYRHRWNVNDVLMWDNRCSAHIALPDFDSSYPRVIHRASLKGEEETGVIAEIGKSE